MSACRLVCTQGSSTTTTNVVSITQPYIDELQFQYAPGNIVEDFGGSYAFTTIPTRAYQEPTYIGGKQHTISFDTMFACFGVGSQHKGLVVSNGATYDQTSPSFVDKAIEWLRTHSTNYDENRIVPAPLYFFGGDSLSGNSGRLVLLDSVKVTRSLFADDHARTVQATVSITLIVTASL